MTKGSDLPPMVALPEYDNPPVIETVLGVQFKRHPKISNSLLALYWKSLGEGWQSPEEVPPIALQHERFGTQQGWGRLGQIQLQLSQDSSLRLKIRNISGTRMVQVQNGRFHYNWMKTPDHDYPRYKNVKIEFEKQFKHFEDFLAQNGITAPEYDQWEVTYVNHLLQGTVWSEPSDWSGIFSGIPHPTLDTLVPETFNYAFSAEIKPQLGRLHIKMANGFKGKPEDKARLLRIELTARGGITPTLPLTTGLDTGREVVVRGFDSMTSPECHKFWKKHGS